MNEISPASPLIAVDALRKTFGTHEALSGILAHRLHNGLVVLGAR